MLHFFLLCFFHNCSPKPLESAKLFSQQIKLFCTSVCSLQFSVEQGEMAQYFSYLYCLDNTFSRLFFFFFFGKLYFESHFS